jgi:hypothetical protein
LRSSLPPPRLIRRGRPLPPPDTQFYNDLVIEPVRKRGLIALLKTMKPLKKGLPGIDDPVPNPNNSLG